MCYFWKLTLITLLKTIIEMYDFLFNRTDYRDENVETE